MGGDEGAAHAGRLAQRAHVDEALAAQAEMRQRAAPALAEHAEAMGVVHDEPGVVTLGQRQQLGQRRDVAIHAEHRIGDDELDVGLAVRQQGLEPIDPAMRVASHLRRRQQAAVDQ